MTIPAPLAPLDRPGTRFLLGRILTHRRSRQRGQPVHVAHVDGRWVYDIDGYVLDAEDHNWADPKRWDAIAQDVFFWRYQPTTGDVVVDIGAGTGTELFSYANRVGEEGRIHMVEAHPGAFNALGRTLFLNTGCSIRMPVTLDRYAIWDSATTLRISADDADANAVGGDEGFAVKAITLDEFINRRSIDRIDFLKMNIEGAELPALRRGSRALEITRHGAIGCHDFRVAEVGNEFFRTKDAVREILFDAGFQVEDRPDARDPWTRDYLYITRH